MRYYFLAFIIYEFLSGAYFYNLYISDKEKYYTKTIDLVRNSFNSAVNGYEAIYDNSYENQSDRLSKFVYLADNASLKERNIIRNKLLNEFMGFFNYQKLKSLNGFHIFDIHGISLLRFHQPLHYDDNIIDKRYSLQLLNKKFNYQKGFEIGIFQESYRFQYPLFYDGEFVGSCEYSVDTQALMDEMEKFYGNYHQFLFDAEPLQKVILKERIEKNYKKIKIGLKDFYLKKRLDIKEINKEKFKYIQGLKDFQNALKSKSATVINYKHAAVVVFPIRDIQNKKFAYMLVYLDKSPISSLKNTFLTEMTFITIFGFMLYLYIFRELQRRRYEKELINLQTDLILISDGKKIEDANNAFLNFFGYKTLAHFKEKNSCICNKFIEEDEYLKGKITELNWIAYIQKNKEQNHKVKMLNAENEERIFSVEIKKIENSHKFFVLFRDITDELKIKAKLEARANFDALTNIFNRSRFEFFLTKELRKSNRYGGVFSLIMFDIDKFKEINDTYGHAVGDSILKELTSLISSHVRDVDIFARWGGEEFMIISQIDINEAEIFAQKLRHMIELHTFKKVGRLTCSFGVTQYKDGDTKASIVKRCDDMLYIAKESGRNRVVSSKYKTKSL